MTQQSDNIDRIQSKLNQSVSIAEYTKFVDFVNRNFSSLRDTGDLLNKSCFEFESKSIKRLADLEQRFNALIDILLIEANSLSENSATDTAPNKEFYVFVERSKEGDAFCQIREGSQFLNDKEAQEIKRDYRCSRCFSDKSIALLSRGERALILELNIEGDLRFLTAEQLKVAMKEGGFITEAFSEK